MSEKKNDKGQAFPLHNTFTDRNGDVITNCIEGMSLRDYFAAKVIMAYCTDWDNKMKEIAKPMPIESIRAALAENAYAMADAMIAERDK